MSHSDRIAAFGRFGFASVPLPHSRNGFEADPEHIVISGMWERENIVRVTIPTSPHFAGRVVRMHRVAAPQFLALWSAWDKAGLLKHVLMWNGSWAPRFKRFRGTRQEREAKARAGTEQDLSNHAWGSAFDINASWNQLGDIPAPIGQVGSVRELVPIAESLGWAWGGHFKGRPDGMHFEIAKLMVVT